MCTSLKGQLDISFVDLPEEISQKPMPPLPPPWMLVELLHLVI